VRATIARELDRDLTLARVEPRGAARVLAGRRVGEDVARRVMAWAPPLDFGAGANPTVPTGPGMWRSAPGVPPMGTFLARSRPWLIDSASQFRPAPPVAYGSPGFEAALDEVRRVARQLTPEQARIARHWGLADPWALWNETASAALRRHHVREPDASRVLALLNVAASDAVLACFEAKYHYWTIRPTQADSTIALPDSIDLPNFPSFPSGHSCSAGAFDAVLGHFIPQERAEFTRMAEEQAMARLYGGVHFRFDNDAGLAVGRAVGRYVVDRERRGALSAAWRAGGAPTAKR
jgi:membrane-associated phospholipid phosphatase